MKNYTLPSRQTSGQRPINKVASPRIGAVSRKKTSSAVAYPAPAPLGTVPPNVQDFEIVIVDALATSIQITWTKGKGEKSLVLVHASAAVNSSPVDNTTYAANAVFASGTQLGTGNYAVYNGSGAAVTITGLTTATTYHIRIFGYNGAAGDEKYNPNTATNNPKSQITD